MKIAKWTLIVIALLFVLPILGFWIHGTFFYEYEMNQIKSDLNEIEGVSVIDIWGHNDLTLENVGARIKIKDKGEIVLLDLSSEANDYPNSVIVSEIGGYKFRSFSCFDYEDKGYHEGISFSLNIGENSEIGNQIGIEFKNPQIVIENYNSILNVVQKLKRVPEWNYYKNDDREIYILVYQDESEMQSLFEKYGADSSADFQNKHILRFDHPNCQ